MGCTCHATEKDNSTTSQTCNSVLSLLLRWVIKELQYFTNKESRLAEQPPTKK